MLAGLYSAATAIHVAQMRQEVIAENLSHLDVPGYRAQWLATESLVVNRPGQMAPPLTGVAPQPVVRDFTAGQFQRTGRTLDVAAQGDGFFVLETPEGRAYTRAGVFHTDGKGRLMSTAGYPVVGRGGPLTMPPDASNQSIIISPQGEITAGGNPVGQLLVVRFDDPNRLRPVGDALFHPPAGMEPQTVDAPQLQQGYRELSNVSATSELINMLIGVRYHEAAQRALTTMSEAISQHIRAQGG